MFGKTLIICHLLVTFLFFFGLVPWRAEWTSNIFVPYFGMSWMMNTSAFYLALYLVLPDRSLRVKLISLEAFALLLTSAVIYARYQIWREFDCPGISTTDYFPCAFESDWFRETLYVQSSLVVAYMIFRGDQLFGGTRQRE